MCSDCAADPALREAWDIFHANLAEQFIDSESLGAREFVRLVGMYHISFVRGWQVSREAMREELRKPLADAREANERLIVALREEAFHREKAAYARGEAAGMQHVIDTIKAKQEEEQLRLYLASAGHKGSA